MVKAVGARPMTQVRGDIAQIQKAARQEFHYVIVFSLITLFILFQLRYNM